MHLPEGWEGTKIRPLQHPEVLRRRKTNPVSVRRWGGSVTPATLRAFTFPAPWMVALSTIRASPVTWHHRKGLSRRRPRLRDIPNSRWRSSCQHGCTRTGCQDLRWEACQTSGTKTDSGANENDNLDPSLGIFLSTLQVQTLRPPYCETPTLWRHFSSTTIPNNSSSQEAAAQKKISKMTWERPMDGAVTEKGWHLAVLKWSSWC